jgi:hypothetical protein
MAEYIIRKMQQAEVPIAMEWARQEGWNPGLEDAKCFYQADPHGFFIGLLDNQPIAVGSAVIYGESYAFCGLYIVKKEFRKKGYGIKLTEERLKYVGSRVTGIDGVLDNVSKYERIGYVASHKQVRYELAGKLSSSIHSQIVEIQKIPFNKIEAYDRTFFPSDRRSFLACWTKQTNGHALAYIQGNDLQGYGNIRKCVHGYKIGPLFANNPEIAQQLFEALCSRADEGPIYLDIPETNQKAQELVNYYKMTPKFEVIRMYRNGFPKINFAGGIFGVTTFELG